MTNKSTGDTIKNKIWSYESPTPAFKNIKGYISFYANGVPWECFVDDEKVTPQEGRQAFMRISLKHPTFDLL